MKWWHILLLVFLGVVLDYWMPAVGNMTLGKLGLPRK